jgi:hypothetical protein
MIVSKFNKTNLLPPRPMTVRVSLFSKNRNFLINSNGDKLNLYKTCSFRRDLQLYSSIFFHLKSSWAQTIDILSRSYIFFKPKMTSNEKHFNYKVVKLIKSYKFRIKFFTIRVHTKKVMILWNSLTLTTMGHVGCRCYHGGLPVPPWATAVVG